MNFDTDNSFCGNCETICPPNQTCCAGSCKDLQTDSAFCGSCTNDCGMSACEGGSCAQGGGDGGGGGGGE